ncbi:hypothetical protein KTE96_01515 [Burkholderia multivorans]|uniref:hypothetical protein n=1 Tax=Burkholderia multivorans TaxID=87883 RepID=UPI001C2441EA|nr:hypothetical protein [Burkholderia multivorans]MBU9610409.1 hypothetical protein [Burkholderia multivorans]MDI3303649.1 hypothetical protein [Burkholderia multivorans]
MEIKGTPTIGAAFATQSANEPRGPRHPRIDRERLNCWVGPRVPLGGKRVDPRIGAYRDLSNKGSERSKADPVAKTYRWDCEEHCTKYHERIGFLYPDHPDDQDDERCGDSDESLDSERRHFIAIGELGARHFADLFVSEIDGPRRLRGRSGENEGERQNNG